MRTLAITQNVTVDGCVEMLTDWFEPQAQGTADMADVLEEGRRQDSESDALLVGRRTFEDFRGYWPGLTDDTTGVSDYLNQCGSTWCPARSRIRSGRTRPCCPATRSRRSRR
ncbi:hypothetical protein [Streptomyces sp. AcE210]|uniref:hypothetical protein n=1 Tax=Streptomyces sp. AcE210 TaxID=2292703 RepID=UPI001F0BBE8A|nr:hypothetical protein [Streptomyces sp. AcE210]